MSDEILSQKQLGNKGVQHLTIRGKSIERVPAELGEFHNLTMLTFEDCTIGDVHPDALKAGPGKGKLAVEFRGGEVDLGQITETIVEHGVGNWKFSLYYSYEHEGWDGHFKALYKHIGNDFAGDKEMRIKMMALFGSAFRYDVPLLPKPATPDRLEYLNIRTKKSRRTGLIYLEKFWPNPVQEHPLTAAAALYLAGKPKYYKLAELKARIEERGWKVVTKPDKATHAIVMEQGKDKIGKALDAGLPIVLEVVLRDLFEAEAPTLIEAGSDAEQNLEALLLSRDPTNVRLALQILQRQTLPVELREELIGVFMFHDDKKIRKEAQAMLLAKGGDAIKRRFDTDRRAYHSISAAAKLRKTARDLEKGQGIDAAKMTRVMVHFFADKGPISLGAALTVALQYPENDPAVFESLRHVKALWLEDLKGPLPKGLETLNALEGLTLSRCKITEYDGQLQAMASLAKLTLQGTEVSDLSLLHDAGRVREVRLDPAYVRDGDLSPIASLVGAQLLKVFVVDSLKPGYGQVRATTGSLDLSAVGSLTGLRTLLLEGPQVTSLAGIEKLTELTSLYVQASQVTDWSPLSACTKLTQLSIDNGRLSDISFLTGCTSLKRLGLKMLKPLSAEAAIDLSPCAGLGELESVDVSRTPLQSLSPLHDLPLLKELSAHWTKVAPDEVQRLKDKKPGLRIHC